MDWYARKPAKYEADTIGLTLAEDGAYNRLLDYYYRTEQPIPSDDKKIAAILRVGLDDWLDVKPVVVGFFEDKEGLYHQETCDEVLTEYSSSKERKASANRENGKKGGRPKGSKNNNKKETKPKINPIENVQKPKANPKEPTDIHTDKQTDISPPNGGGALPALIPPEEPKATKTKRGTRLPEDWEPSPKLLVWAGGERPDLDLKRVLEVFHDHWRGASGQRGVKSDWDATYRNWIRKEGGSNAAQTRGRGAVDPQAQRRTDNDAILGACGYNEGMAGDMGRGPTVCEEPGAVEIQGGNSGRTEGSGSGSDALQPGGIRGGPAETVELLPALQDGGGRGSEAPAGGLPGAPELSTCGPVAAGGAADNGQLEISGTTEADQLQGEHSGGIEGKEPAPQSGPNRADETQDDLLEIPDFLRLDQTA